MIKAEQVQSLNRKIEELNAQGTRAKAKLEVLEGNLSQALEDYASQYGVDLHGKNMKVTAANIQKELAAVEEEVQREFELRNAVVAAIERGDIEEANRLLGVEPAEEVEEEPEDVVEVEEASDAEDFGVGEDYSEEEYVGPEDFSDAVSALQSDAEDEEPDSFSFGGLDFDLDEGEIPDPEPVVPQTPASGLKRNKSGKKSAPMGSSVDDTVSELDGGFGDIDIDDDDLDDFGFGDMLKGTRFSLDD